MKSFFGVSIMMLMIASNCLAMTFSSPVKTGFSVWWIQGGGGINVENATKNNGDFYQHNIPNGKKIIYDGSNQGGIRYGKGVAYFGDGNDALYAHYNGYNIRNDSFIHFGSNDIKNTIPISAFVFGEEIFKINTNAGITFYMIHTSYDLPDETWWTLIGRRNDGVWLKYFESVKIIEQYFGKQGNVWDGKSICCDKFKIVGDTIVIEYSLYHKNVDTRGELIKIGEFRFKWDEEAQWFSVGNVQY